MKKSLRRRRKVAAAKFLDFISIHPPSEVSRHLRCIFLDYIGYHWKAGLPRDFDKYVWEMYDLFNLLDKIESIDDR